MNKLVCFGIGAGYFAYRLLRGKTDYSFRDKTVLITGGSRGLGLVLARAFVAEGAKVALMARDHAELERAEADLKARGGNVLIITGDVRERASATAAVNQTINHFGQLDVLVNDAGVIQAGPLENMDVADFTDALAVHLYGPLYTMLAARPHMRQRGEGRIVNIASIGGKIAVPHLVPYCTSKFALAGLSNGMRAELAQDNIKITTVFPGLMRTGSHYNALFKGQHEREFTWFSIIDALPFTSVSAEHAAREIVEACRRGDPELVISVQAKVLARVAPLLPNVAAHAMALFNRTLPDPDPVEGNQTQTGWESTSNLAPSLLTRLADQATIANNGLKEHPPAKALAQGISQETA